MPASLWPQWKENGELQFGKVRITHTEMGHDEEIMGLPFGVQVYCVHR